MLIGIANIPSFLHYTCTSCLFSILNIYDCSCNYVVTILVLIIKVLCFDEDARLLSLQTIVCAVRALSSYNIKQMFLYYIWQTTKISRKHLRLHFSCSNCFILVTLSILTRHTYVQYIIARYILIVGRNWKKFQLTIFQGKEYREKLKVEEEREYLLVYFIKEMRIEENQQEEN